MRGTGGLTDDVSSCGSDDLGENGYITFRVETQNSPAQAGRRAFLLI